MPRVTAMPLGEALLAAAHPLTGSARDYDLLMDLIGDARVVLLGEASHGTHEFYRERARITQRLIEERGPETERISHYFEARLPEQFDAVIHLDETTAVEPLDLTSGWETGDVPETYPSGQ